jgi:NADH:ubiquinone oxidoreductase subunit 3 (subunit A)
LVPLPCWFLFNPSARGTGVVPSGLSPYECGFEAYEDTRIKLIFILY